MKVETKFYAGIGARATPARILKQMIEIGDHLGSLNWILRSGHAYGADLAFEKGAKEHIAQIWLPWKTFNANYKKFKYHTHEVIQESDKEAFDSVAKYHPNSSGFSKGVLALMARNYRQIVGINSRDSEFVVCWTPDGKASGGTGQALRIAEDKGIPIYNLFHKDVYEEVMAINY